MPAPRFSNSSRHLPVGCLVLLWCALPQARGVLAADQLSPIGGVEHQPFIAATGRLLQALDYIGAPLPDDDLQDIRAAMSDADQQAAVTAIQQVLDRHCLAQVNINPESRVSAIDGPAPKELVQQGWRHISPQGA